MTRRAELIRQHTPSLTAKAEAAIDEVLLKTSSEYGVDYADVAIRECPCGLMIDGFYEFTDHIQKVLEEAGL